MPGATLTAVQVSSCAVAAVPMAVDADWARTTAASGESAVRAIGPTSPPMTLPLLTDPTV